MEYNYASPEHRLYDAAARWYPEPHWGGPAELIEAATQCLVEGLDSPSLRVLAGASADDVGIAAVGASAAAFVDSGAGGTSGGVEGSSAITRAACASARSTSS